MFRFILVRPAIEQDPSSISLGQRSDYQQALRAAVETGAGRLGIEQASEAFVASPSFVGEVGATPLGAQLDRLADRIDALEREKRATRDIVTAAIRNVFGQQPREVVAGAPYKDTVRRLRDSLIAIKVLQRFHALPIERLTRQLRTAELIAELVGGASAPGGDSQPDAADDRGGPDPSPPGNDEALRRKRRRSLALPIDLGLTSRLSTRDTEQQMREQREAQLNQRAAEIEELLGVHQTLRTAMSELSALESASFRVSDRAPDAAAPPPDAVRLSNAATLAAAYTGDLRRRQLREDPVIGEAAPGTGIDLPFATLAQTLVSAQGVVLPGRAAFTAPDLSEIGFVLKPSAAERLSEPTRAALSDRGLDLAAMPLDRLTHRLETDLAGTVARLEAVAGHPVRKSLVRFGDALISIETPLTKGWGEVGTGGVVTFPAPTPMDGSVPATKGDVAPAGVADLLLVKQQLTGYEAADVAHVENVLRGERKVREHTRREASEVITFTERETVTSEEHELETTDRFEMTRETSQTIKEDLALKAGLSISGSYGPTVEFSASAEGSATRSKEEATKAATTFSQDVTERSSRKIAERVLQRTTVRTTTETIEKNTHELDNLKGAGHISGVYQWVNKVYRAQIFNYGVRAMFDFMIPEPAAFLIKVLDQAHTSSVTLTKPSDFTLLPAQLNESNYGFWVGVCGATDVAPPPELYRTKSADFKAGGGDSKTNYHHSAQIAIDDGYRAVFGSVATVRNIWEADHSVDVALGRRTQRLSGGTWLWTTSLDDERDSIPLAIDSFHCSQVAVAVEVKCQRTDRAMEKWRLETHAKLQTAHQAKVADYEEKLAALKIQAGVAIRGRNPAANQLTIRKELQKNCVSILTDQHFDLFDAVVDSPVNGLPQIDVAEAAVEGAYVRFFEQAFEWEHMSWVSYPYFWGSKDQWDERLGYDDPDPAFTEFLQSGYCRVTVPARPGFEGAIDHFLTFGEIWNGGPLPSISSPLYLPIADELAERLGRPGTEVPQGEPWKVLVPTNLVKLRADDKLPRWKLDADGEWVEA
ncbi:hypothetical protein ACIBHY_43290 [Nonomuraea sp. NPDC050547]|uniref:hypothetical protein n=1 Tax=Nonomuraea sp. NPDC050547 TaxID=3364368 RepID=UPI003797E114